MRLCIALALSLMVTFFGCHPRPVEDLVLADVALKAAQKVKGDSLAPDAFRKAENYYLRAKKDYSEGYFDSSKKFSNEARILAERAEFKALQRQIQVRGQTDDNQNSTNSGKPR